MNPATAGPDEPDHRRPDEPDHRQTQMNPTTAPPQAPANPK